jgi:membrane-associated protein
MAQAGAAAPRHGGAADNRRVETLLPLADFVLHVDRHLREFVLAHGGWVYALLFAIVFVETGLVVMPFLPGDSLLFVVGALCGAGLMHLAPAIGLLWLAATLGNQTNYTIGRAVGARVWGWEQSRWFNRRAFERAHGFYERHGGITLVAARFVPFLRTFAPFVAGVARMGHGRFTAYDVAGGGLWVGSLVGAGYLFGNLPWVQANFSLIVWLMIGVPGVLALAGAWRARRAPP